MKSLDFYILKQFLGPFLLIVSVLTLVIWMTQSLQRVDILVENGRGIGLFLYISVLVIPSLLVILIPFALFGACLYSLYRLHTDSEIAVIFAAGVSRMRIALPILMVTFVGALVTLYIALDLSPRTYRTLKRNIVDIRTDLAGSVLRSGEFNTIIDGFTIYIHDVSSGQRFSGILIHDYRNPNQSRTYIAERGTIRTTDFGPVLFLVNGNIQRSRADWPAAISRGEDPQIELLPFEETRINIAALQSNENAPLELTERYLPELLNPDAKNEWERRNSGKMIAEAHSRLAAPFHAIAYVLVGMFALIGGAYSRRGYAIRIVTAAAAVIALRVLGYIANNLSAETGLHFIHYALPLSVVIGMLTLLFDVSRFLPKARAGVATAGQL